MISNRNRWRALATALLAAWAFPPLLAAQPPAGKTEAQLRKEFAEAIKRKQKAGQELLPLEKRKLELDREVIDRITDRDDAADTLANDKTGKKGELQKRLDKAADLRKTEAEQREVRKRVKAGNDDWQKLDKECDRLREPLDRLDQARKEAREDAEKRLKAEADELRKQLGTADAERRAAQLEALAQRQRADAEADAWALAERANASVAADPYRYLVNVLPCTSQAVFRNDPDRAQRFEAALRRHPEITGITRSEASPNGVTTVTVAYTVSPNTQIPFGPYWTRAEADERVRRLTNNGFTVNLTTVPK